MRKKAYIEPVMKERLVAFSDTYLLTASEEGIGDGGPGNSGDDPDTKHRADDWGSLW